MSDIIVPFLGANDQEAKITKVYFNESEFVEKNSLIIELETSKTTYEIESEVSGYISLSISEGDKVSINQKIGHISASYKKFNININSDSNNVKFTLKAKDCIKSKNLQEDQLLNFYPNKKLIKLSDVEKFLDSSHDNKLNKNQLIINENLPYIHSSMVVKIQLQENIIKDFLSHVLISLKIINSHQFFEKLINQNKKEINIGLLMEFQNKLLVHNIEINQFANINEINAFRFKEMINLKKEGKLKLNNKKPFAYVSYLENSDIEYQNPILPKDAAFILGFGSIIFENQKPIINCTCVYDHGYFNGTHIAKFLKSLKDLLEV